MSDQQPPPRDPREFLTPEEVALHADLQADQASARIAGIAQRKFGDSEGVELLTYILTRLGYFKIELHTPRDVWYRNAASFLLTFLGLTTKKSTVVEMVDAAVKQAQREAMRRAKQPGVAQHGQRR